MLYEWRQEKQSTSAAAGRCLLARTVRAWCTACVGLVCALRTQGTRPAVSTCTASTAEAVRDMPCCVGRHRVFGTCYTIVRRRYGSATAVRTGTTHSAFVVSHRRFVFPCRTGYAQSTVQCVSRCTHTIRGNCSPCLRRHVITDIAAQRCNFPCTVLAGHTWNTLMRGICLVSVQAHTLIN